MESEVLDVAGAAKLLMCHPKTIQAKALAKKMPATKVMGQWRFIKVDLIEWLRQSASGQSGAVANQETVCRSINVAKFGGYASTTEGKKYEELLGLKTKSRPSNSTTTSKRTSGSKKS